MYVASPPSSPGIASGPQAKRNKPRRPRTEGSILRSHEKNQKVDIGGTEVDAEETRVGAAFPNVAKLHEWRCVGSCNSGKIGEAENGDLLRTAAFVMRHAKRGFTWCRVAFHLRRAFPKFQGFLGFGCGDRSLVFGFNGFTSCLVSPDFLIDTLYSPSCRRLHRPRHLWMKSPRLP